VASSVLSSIMNTNWSTMMNRGRTTSRGHESLVEDQVFCANPPSIEDTSEAAERLMEGQKVIVNLTGVQFDQQQRIVDFLMGVAFGLGGAGSRIADGVFMFVPEGVEVEMGGVPSQPSPFAQQQQTVRPRVIR
jgi:FtsZ-interacting cell division protein YlmF